MDVVLIGTSNDVISVDSKQLDSMFLIVSGMPTISRRCMHWLNEYLLRLIIELGDENVTCVMILLENAYIPMYFSVDGMLTLSRDAQLLKQYMSILEIFSLSVSVLRDVHPLNAYESIVQGLSH